MRRRFRLASSGLALAGLFISAYLALFEVQPNRGFFCPIGACEVVNTSPYVYMFGVPLAFLGLGGYALILALNLAGLVWEKEGAKRTTLLLFVVSLLGTALSAYLTYLELFVLRAICIWCVASALIVTAICALSAWELLSRPKPQV